VIIYRHGMGHFMQQGNVHVVVIAASYEDAFMGSLVQASRTPSAGDMFNYENTVERQPSVEVPRVKLNEQGLISFAENRVRVHASRLLSVMPLRLSPPSPRIHTLEADLCHMGPVAAHRLAALFARLSCFF